MRILSKACAVVLFFALVSTSRVAQLPAQETVQAEQPSGRVVLVLPFENRSGNASLNWIGDSFTDTLDKRLNSAGFLTISQEDRRYAYEHLGLPAGFNPSRATTIRIAQQLDADSVIVGSFNVTKGQISIQARVLSIDELTLSKPLQDGADLNRLFDAENAIAWKIAKVLDPQLNVAEETFLAAPGEVPLPAFEDYIRGTTAPTAQERLMRLQSAVAIVPDYAAALLAMGRQQYAARNYDAAADALAKVPKDSPLALEANFYLGLSRFNSANYDAAATAFGFVESRLPLPEVVNDEAVALSRQGKDGIALFRRAAAADPSNEDYHYNLAIALYRQGDTVDALRQASTALKLKPDDNDASELHAHLSAATPGSKLDSSASSTFSPVERIIRTYSEAGFRQAAFQIDQMRAVRMAMLPAAKRAVEYTEQGRDYLKQGLLPEAEREFQSALTADANSAAAHAGLARVREATGDVKQARAQALASIKLQPNAEAYMVLARLDLAAKQMAASAADVANALRVEPSNAAALALRQKLQQSGQAVP